MAEGPGPPGGPFRRGCTIWFAGQAVVALVGMGLGLFAMARNAPFWLIGVAVLGPPVLYALVVFAILGRWLSREYREFSRNAPSPESVASPAGGAGVEASPFRDPALDRAGSFDGLPTVPAIATDPGKVLAHRLLEADLPPGCQFGCTVFAALFWNGILSIFVWRLVGDWNRMGGFKWLYVAFLSPFALVGIGMVLAVLAAALKWFVSSLVGRIEVELAEHPVFPGGPVRVHVAQRGPVLLGHIEVRLICTEAATYTAGTSTSTATREVARHLLSNPDETSAGLPLEFDSTIPPDSMHAFESPNNKINWTVRVSGRALGLKLRLDYRLAVVPGESP